MESHVRAATLLANFLDNQFHIGGLRFGFSAVIDLIPGVGDVIDAGLSMYLIWIAVQMRVPALQLLQMFWNILMNFFIGLIPLIGDAAYIFRRANLRNLAIIQNHAKQHSAVVEGQIIR